jgi:vacuolar-type H+-ATPase subunit H
MSKDVSRQSPKIARPGPGEQPGPGEESGESATDRAQAMRTRLGAQREAEEMLAEASQLRRAAAEGADVIVSEAETLAHQLVSEAREAAAKTASEAQERADGILARARFEADDLQRHTEEERARIREEVLAVGRAEIEEFRTRTAGLLDDAEGGLRQLAPSLEGAVGTVVDVLHSLEELRQGPADRSDESTQDGESELALSERSDADPDADPVADPDGSEDAAAGPTNPDDPDARPLGWLFRASQG